jgi:hypothetical protein
LPKFKGNAKIEAELFKTLLCAIYNRPYTVKNTKFLVALTELADYYRALPVVSRTLSDALLDSRTFVNQMQVDEPYLICESAARLHHKVLFRDALIWVVGRWQVPLTTEVSDRKLRQIAECAHGKIATSVSKILGKIMLGFCAYGSETWSFKFRKSICGPQLNDGPNLYVQADTIDFEAAGMYNCPQFFRNILTKNDWRRRVKMEGLGIEELLENHLVLDQRNLAPGVVSDNLTEYYFLCATVADDDLPWHPEEIDW